MSETPSGADENRPRHEAWERAHELGSPTHRLRRRLVLRLVDGLSPVSKNCLDAGCGVGEFSIELAKRGWQVCGFDPSRYAVGLAQEHAEAAGTHCDFRVSSVERFEPEENFGLVLAVDVLEHIGDDVEALRRFASWLAPGGILLATVPADASLWSEADEFSGHYRRYSPDSLSRRAGAAGLGIDTLLSYGYPMTRMMWRIKKRAPRAESWVVSSSESGSASRRRYAKLLASVAGLLTSPDLLFTTSLRGVGLVALLSSRQS